MSYSLLSGLLYATLRDADLELGCDRSIDNDRQRSTTMMPRVTALYDQGFINALYSQRETTINIRT